MKNKLWTLFKITTNNNLNINKKLGKKKIGGIITAILLALFALIMSGMYSYLLISYLHPLGMGKYAIILFSAIAVISAFMTTIYRSKSMLFDSKDNDLLFSLPIKFSTILSNRVLNLLSINYVLSGVIFIPTLIIYACFAGVTPIYILSAIIVFILLPMIPTVLASIIGYLSAFVASKFGAKKIIELIFTFGFFALIMFASMKLQDIAMTAISNIGSIDLFITKYLAYFNWIGGALTQTNILPIIYYILANIITFALFVFTLAKGYSKITSKLKETKVKKKTKEINYNSSNVLTSLVKKEFKKFISTPIYVFNTAFGIVLLVLVAIGSIFLGTDGLIQFMNMEGMENNIIFEFAPLLILGIISFLTLMSNTAACSISLEGNNLWIIKSLPVTTKQIFNAKLIVNLLVIIPISLICILILGIVLKLSVLNIILFLVYEIVLAITIAEFGLLINLKFPKLKFESEVQVVKQSLSTFIAIFAPMILFFVASFILGMFMALISFTNILVILILACIVLVIIQKIILNTWGIKKFSVLE